MSSSWRLPTLSPPEYLKSVVEGNTDYDLKLYSLKLGLTPNLKRISPGVNVTRKFHGSFSSGNIPAPFTDPPIIRSEAWSSFDMGRPSKKRPCTQFKTKFLSCIKSAKCRFTALGLLLGWLTSLGALIPILIFWLRSGSASNITTTPSSISTGLTGFSFDVLTVVPSCNAGYCQEAVIFNSNMTITSLSLVITIQLTGGETYAGAFETHSSINSTYINTTSQLIYSFSLSNSSLSAGNYTCGAEFNFLGVNHTTSTDTYSITVTNLCGITKTQSGTF